MRIVFGVGLEFDRHGERIPCEFAHAKTERAIAEATRLFGGCFATMGKGGWHDGSKAIVEQGMALMVDKSTPTLEAHAALQTLSRDFARWLAAVFNQTAIHVTYFPEAESKLIGHETF